MTMLPAGYRSLDMLEPPKHPRDRVFRAVSLAVFVGLCVAYVMLGEERPFDDRTSGVVEMIAVSSLFGGFMGEYLVDRWWPARSALSQGIIASALALTISLVTMIAMNGIIFTLSDFRVHEPVLSIMGMKQLIFTLLFGSGYFVIFGLRLLFPYALFGFVLFGFLVTWR